MANSAKIPKNAPYFIEDEQSIVLYSDDRNITMKCEFIVSLPIFHEKEYQVTLDYLDKPEAEVYGSIMDTLTDVDNTRSTILYAAHATGRFKKALKGIHKDTLELCYYEKRAKNWLEHKIWDICNEENVTRVSAIKRLISQHTV